MPKLLTLLLPLLGLLVVSGVQAQPARRALLIGVSHYDPRCPPSDQPKRCDENYLAGPHNDLARLSRDLKDRFGYTDGEITILEDGQALKPRVLKALDDLAVWARPGSEIFIYFSGHGTSNLDSENGAQLGLPDATGALVLARPPSGGASSIQTQLLVGVSEVRPLLLRMDQAGANVFAVVDACFSQNSLRAASGPERRYRSPQLGRNSAGRPSLSNLGHHPQEPWPYSHVAWLSAASADEPSLDLDPPDGRTVDGLVHGALTDALLRVIEGSVKFTDADGRHTLSYAELFNAAAGFMRRKGYSQTPQVMPSQLLGDARSAALLNLPAFGQWLPSTPAGGNTGQDQRPQGGEERSDPMAVTVSLDTGAAGLRGMLSKLPGVLLTGNAAEYRIEPAPGNGSRWSLWTGTDGKDPVLRAGSGAPMSLSTDELRETLRIRGLLRQLMGRARTRATGLSLQIGPEDNRIGGTVRLGEPLTLLVNASQDVTVALVDLMGDGTTRVWVPGDAATCPAGTQVKAGVVTRLCTWPGSAAPYGLDLLYAIAASGSEPALAGIQSSELNPATEQVLEQVVAKHAGPVAIAEYTLFTAGTP